MKYISLLITQVSESDYTHMNEASTKINAFDILTTEPESLTDSFGQLDIDKLLLSIP